MPPTCALRPVNPNNASPLRITAAAGTELAVDFFSGFRQLFADIELKHIQCEQQGDAGGRCKDENAFIRHGLC